METCARYEKNGPHQIAPLSLRLYQFLLTGEFTANTSLPHYCRDNGLLLHIYRTMHAVIDRQKTHGIHFHVLAKALRLSGEDHIHTGTVVGKLEGEREIFLGFVDLLCDYFVEQDRSRGIYFTQDWVSLPGVMSVRGIQHFLYACSNRDIWA